MELYSFQLYLHKYLVLNEKSKNVLFLAVVYGERNMVLVCIKLYLQKQNVQFISLHFISIFVINKNTVCHPIFFIFFIM